MKVMVTGAAGFIGRFLANYCREAGCCVLGLGANAPGETWTDGIFELCDIRDARRLSQLIVEFEPDRIFHLAAQSYPTVSLAHPRETIDINVGGTVNLFECLRTVAKPPLVIVACSSAEYGPVASTDLPVREEHPLRPLHPYGVSKVAQDLLAAQYFANYAIPSVRLRIFNTTGPGKVGDVCSDLTRRTAEIELGIRPPLLTVGNLTSRSVVDVRDLVRGLWSASEKGSVGDVYNLGGGHTYSVREIVEIIQVYSRVAFSVEQDPLLMRGCDEPVIAGDIRKFQRCTGWTAEIELSETLRDMLDWWRKRLDYASERFGRVADKQPSEVSGVMQTQATTERILRADLEGSVEIHKRLLMECLPSISSAANVILSAFCAGRKALFFGNGGSAADAQHLAAEFVGRHVPDRDPMPAVALSANSSTVTAIGNDYEYEEIFARQIQALGASGDVAVAMSTSGNSPNVTEAVIRARRLGLRTIGLTGASGGCLRDLVDVLIAIPSDETQRIQECHILVGHTLCNVVEQALDLKSWNSFRPPQ